MNRIAFLVGGIAVSFAALGGGYVPSASVVSVSQADSESSWSEVSSLASTQVIYLGSGFYVDPNLYLRASQHTLALVVDAVFLRMDVSVDNGPWTQISGTGGGFNPVYWSSPWSTPGAHDLGVRWFALGGAIIYHSYDVVVVPPASRLFVDAAGNRMVSWKGGSASMDKPFLIVEGFDPENNVNPASESGPELYYAAAGQLAAKAALSGGDFVVIDFSDGGDDMTTNSGYVDAAVRYIDALNPQGDDVRLAGISMGGVVVRHALAKAEDDGNPLPVSHFISLDGPQQGAVIDSGLLDEVEEELGSDEKSLSSVAAQQLLVYNPFDPSGTAHSSFYADLNTLNGDGYPSLTHNIAVAFSNASSIPSTGTWLTIKVYEPITGALLKTTNFSIATSENIRVPGSYLPQSSTMLFGAGSLPVFEFITVFWEMIRSKNPTFIPHHSALDIVAGSSKFDVTLVPTLTSFHDHMPTSVIDPLLIEIGLRDPVSVSMSGPSWLDFGEPGTWSASASAGAAPYTFQWEYMLNCPGGGAKTAAEENERASLGASLGSEATGGATVLGKLVGGVVQEPKYKEPPVTNAVQCGQWYPGGSNSSFTISSVSHMYPPTVRVTVNDQTAYTDSDQKYISVYPPGVKVAERRSLESATELVARTDLSVHPNPARDRVTLTFAVPESRTVRADVYDVSGRLAQSSGSDLADAGMNRIQLDLASLPVGIYFIRLAAGTDVWVKSIVVQ